MSMEFMSFPDKSKASKIGFCVKSTIKGSSLFDVIVKSDKLGATEKSRGFLISCNVIKMSSNALEFGNIRFWT